MSQPDTTIRHVGESFEDSVVSIGVAADDDLGGETFALIFSAAEPPDEDGYSVVVEPGQRTEYGAVEGCELGRSTLRLVFTSAAAAVLDLPRAIVLGLSVSDDKRRMLERGLRRVGVPIHTSEG